jgi:hypothetical protein
MARLGFVLSDEMQRLFDTRAASRGGRSAALRALVHKAVVEEGNGHAAAAKTANAR